MCNLWNEIDSYPLIDKPKVDWLSLKVPYFAAPYLPNNGMSPGMHWGEWSGELHMPLLI